MTRTPRKHPVWWHGCAFCPDGGKSFTDQDRPVVVLYRRRLRRVHLLCLPFALAAGSTMPPLVAPPAAAQESLFTAVSA